MCDLRGRAGHLGAALGFLSLLSALCSLLLRRGVSACEWHWSSAGSPCSSGAPGSPACPQSRGPRRARCVGWSAPRRGGTCCWPSDGTCPWHPRSSRPHSRWAGTPDPGRAALPSRRARRRDARTCRWWHVEARRKSSADQRHRPWSDRVPCRDRTQQWTSRPGNN